MDHVGDGFTCFLGRVKERIDWALCTTCCLLKYNQSKVYGIPSLSSMGLITVHYRSLKLLNRPWVKELNSLDAKRYMEDSFHDLVENSLVNSKSWNRQTLGSIPSRKILGRIEELEMCLQSEQSGYIKDFEKRLWADSHKLLKQEELLWYQKSRCVEMGWGNRKTKLFHASTLNKERGYRTSLSNGF